MINDIFKGAPVITNNITGSRKLLTFKTLEMLGNIVKEQIDSK